MPKSWGLQERTLMTYLAGGGGVIMGLVNLHFILLKVNGVWDQTPGTPPLGNGRAGVGELQTLCLGEEIILFVLQT